ncbi:MAG TPA: AI-2E family transporter [Burkholderiales bacterium]|nr:AI-2E family transporter [Burkholderiales bacterium]
MTRSNGSLAAVVLVAAVLYLAREVLIPLALAILLSFLLAPGVRHLERWRLGRIPSTLLAVLIGFSVIAAVGWIAARQAVQLVAKLPEYRANVTAKIRDLRQPQTGDLGKAAEAIKDLERQADPAPQKPVPVVATPKSPFAQLIELIEPFAKPVGTALAVLVFTILILLNRENMRERLIALFGAGRINLTTQAMGEASYRVSRYLAMQLLMNVCFGVPFGIALWLIGVPNAALWGMLAVVLRFIPYAGVWIAVALPAMLAFAISDGWAMVGWTLGVFLALELILVNAVEPWVYGRSAGLSPIAIIAAAIFWTWLWGPVGLLLATPLTVCVAVLGRYVPEMGYLNVLLGVEPVLAPEARFYQRLVAQDAEEAQDIAERHAAEHGVADLYDRVIIPALGLAERDRHAGALDEERAGHMSEIVARILEDLDSDAPKEAGEAAICIAAAHDRADHLAGMMLAHAVREEQSALVLPFPVLAGETLEMIGERRCKTVCISAVPPHAASHAGYLCKRLKQRFPELRVVVVLWTGQPIDTARSRLEAAGVDAVATRLPEALERLRG